MKSDFSRDTFDPARHFSRVLMQQGRVQLDADWNEQAAILLHYLQTLAADLIGPHAGPSAYNGFGITFENGQLTIGEGRYYVDGILCENDTKCTYATQPDYPLPPDKSLDIAKLIGNSGPAVAYLDVWERLITHLDDEHIREVALGGPDTATRARVVWQVKLMAAQSCDEAAKFLIDANDQNRLGRMQAQLASETVDPDPCITAPDSKYRGAENQLYRVEIHQGTKDQYGKDNKNWSFKWSRENGSVLAAWLGVNEDGGLVLNSTRGFEAGNWVEITSTADELMNQPGRLMKVSRVEGGAIYLDTTPEWDKNNLQKVRRWDQTEIGDIVLMDGAVTGDGKQWFDLEDGIQVHFETGKEYRTGDYWMFPARVATGQIEWPEETDASGRTGPAALFPKGIQHHYATLAQVILSGGQIKQLDDCRDTFSPLENFTAAKG